MNAAFRWPLLLLSVLVFPIFSVAQETASVSSPAVATQGTPGAVPKFVWSQCHVNGQYIAMTFDDGPSAALTPKLLDILKEKQMHVTFFVLGEMVKPHPEIIKRAVAEGHEIGNHSWDHPDLAKKPDDFVRSQLNRTQEIITQTIGKPVTLMRPPYGSFTKDQRRWFHDDLGYTIVLWDVDPLDWKKPVTSTQVEERIVGATHNGSIILSHDIHATTVEAMPETFDKLLAEGFKFVTVSELIAMNQAEPPKPGRAPGSAKADPSASPKAGVDPSLPAKITGSSN